MKLIVMLLATTAYVAADVAPMAQTPKAHIDLHKNLEPSGDGRIIDGKNASRHQFPYQASLRWSATNANYRHICGGTLISNTRVLTAAHCRAYETGIYQIVLGQLIQHETNSDIQTFEFGGSSSQFVVHPDYTGKPGSREVLPNDIAVIKLPKLARFTGAVQPAYLPMDAECNAIQIVFLSGWGLTDSSNVNTPPLLQWVDVPRITNADCTNRLRSILGTSGPLNNAMICTGPSRKNESACSGDSGGPLVLQKTSTVSTVNYVIGAVSWGINPCGNPNAPSVYTRVCSHMNFISKHM